MGEGMWSRSRSAALALCPFPARFPDLCVDVVAVVLLASHFICTAAVGV